MHLLLLPGTFPLLAFQGQVFVQDPIYRLASELPSIRFSQQYLLSMWVMPNCSQMHTKQVRTWSCADPFAQSARVRLVTWSQGLARRIPQTQML